MGLILGIINDIYMGLFLPHHTHGILKIGNSRAGAPVMMWWTGRRRSAVR
jgi:hypothetical protein